MKSFTLAVAAAVALAAGTASAAQVWTAPASLKVRPAMQAPAGAPSSMALSAAKNEFESFHVVVTGQASGVSMALESMTDGQGHSISGRELVLYREALINVTTPSGGDGASGVWPDALIPNVDPIVGETRNAFPFDVPAGESRAVLVDIHAPAATPAGVYHGTVVVSGGVSANIPVTLTVWDFAVPSTSTMRSAYGLSWNGPCMGHHDSGCSNVAAEEALRARYVQTALDNHISIDAPFYSAPVTAGGSQDWSEYDKYVGPFLDGTGPGRLQGAKLTAVQIQGGAWSSAAVSAWASHFKAKGWAGSLFNYICDEPPLTCRWSDINGRIAASRAGEASVPTLVTTTATQAKAQGVTGIDLFVPVVNFMEGKPGADFAGNQRANYPATIWWYQSCMSFGCAGVGGGLDAVNLSGWPSYAIDTDGTRNRAQEWLSYGYNIQGELYYETTQAYFSGDPWTQQYNFGGTGDGNLFYPGTPAKIGGQTEIPVESLRMKGIRDGMEDYELLAYATRLGLGAQALQIAHGVYPKTFLATTSLAAIDSARAELAGLILHALGKDLPPGPGPTDPGPGTGPGVGPGTGPATGPGTGPATGPGTGSAPDSADGSGIASQAVGNRSLQPHRTGLSAVGYPTGGCSSGGVQSAWLALPFMAMLALRRRRKLAMVRRHR